jgi:4-amino-4-deoxy-L-arabinose transferase-like glycosyltransferase
MKDLHTSKPLVWALLIAFCAVWFYGLAARTLVPTDEGRYAEMAREMVTTNDWITPRLNATKYFEKPPLQNWMNALTFKAFGFGEWQARLWTGLCGLLGIALVAWTGRKVFSPRIGFTAAVVLASSFLWAALGHVNTLDMGLSGMMTLALCGLLLGQREGASPRERRNWMLACWAGMALAVMSKGLIGIVLPGAVLVLYTFLARDWSIWKRLHLGLGLLVFFAITTPWFVLVARANPEFLHFFFIHEHFERFTSKVHNRAGPIYYFVPIMVLGIFPWLGVLLQSLWRGWGDVAGKFQPKKLLLIWSVFIFVFFSISNSKLPSYVLPIFPALALLIACYLEQASHKTMAFNAGLLTVFSAVGLLFVPGISRLGSETYEIPLYQAYEPWVAAAAILAIFGSIGAILLARRQQQWAIVLLAATGFVGGQLLMLGHEPLGRYAAGTAHLAAIKAELTPQTPIYVVGRYEQSLPFYLGRTLTMVQHADEMEFGLKQEPHLWLPTRNEFVAKWLAQRAAGVKAVAILNHHAYEEFRERGVPMRVIGQDPRRVIVVNDSRSEKTKP